MRSPLLLLTFAMTQAIQPVLTEINHDKYELEQLHNKFVRYMSLLELAVSIGVYFLSEVIASVLLGSQWGGVVQFLKILSVIIPVQIILSSVVVFIRPQAELIYYLSVFFFVNNCLCNMYWDF
jgi:PST family polysaccharide transporter